MYSVFRLFLIISIPILLVIAVDKCYKLDEKTVEICANSISQAKLSIVRGKPSEQCFKFYQKTNNHSRSRTEYTYYPNAAGCARDPKGGEDRCSGHAPNQCMTAKFQGITGKACCCNTSLCNGTNKLVIHLVSIMVGLLTVLGISD